MGLFDQPLAAVAGFKERKGARGTLQRFAAVSVDAWRSQPEVLLGNQTRLELGHPQARSLSLLLWQDRVPGPSSGETASDEVLLVGPNLHEASGPHLPFAQVVTVVGDFEAAYDCYRQLREAVYRVGLQGTMLRVRPSRQSIWWRLGTRALQAGLDAQILGSAVIAELKRLPFVAAVEVLLVTESTEAVLELAEAGDRTREIVDALIRMHEQDLELDCESCTFAPVCDGVAELRRLHQQLQARHAAGAKEEEQRL